MSTVDVCCCKCLFSANLLAVALDRCDCCFCTGVILEFDAASHAGVIEGEGFVVEIACKVVGKFTVTDEGFNDVVTAEVDILCCFDDNEVVDVTEEVVDVFVDGNLVIGDLAIVEVVGDDFALFSIEFFL